MTTTQTTDASDHDEFEPAPPDKLYAHYCRQLSAMMDSELSPDEAKFMLRRLEHDTALAGCWERWQICGDVLRGRHHALLPADFAHRVALAIADDGRTAVAMSAISAAKSSPRLARWGGGAALAASVAVVAFLVARQLPGDATSAPESSSATSSVVVAQPATPPVPAPSAPLETAPLATTDTPAAGTGAALATAAVAMAEVPRRASERRARAEGRRTANRVRETRDVATPPPIVVAAELPVLADVPTTDTKPTATADPFAASTIVPARPWPRAILQAYPADSAFTAGYGSPAASAGFAPFEPRPEQRLQPGAVPMPAQAEADGAGPGSETRDGTPPR